MGEGGYQIAVSSSYIEANFCGFVGISCVCIMFSKGASYDPCGTPG